MDALAVIGALIALLVALLEHRWATAPARAQADLEQDYARDMHRADAAIASGADGARPLSALFEDNRQDGITRGALDPRPPGAQPGAPGPIAGGLRELPGAATPDGPGGGPADRPAA